MKFDFRLQSSACSLQLTAPDCRVSNSFTPLSVCPGFTIWAKLGSVSTILPSLELADCLPGGLGNVPEVSLSSVFTHWGLQPPSLSCLSVFSLQQLWAENLCSRCPWPESLGWKSHKPKKIWSTCWLRSGCEEARRQEEEEPGSGFDSAGERVFS